MFSHRYFQSPRLATQLDIHLDGDFGRNGHQHILLTQCASKNTLGRYRVVNAQELLDGIISVLPIGRKHAHHHLGLAAQVVLNCAQVRVVVVIGQL